MDTSISQLEPSQLRKGNPWPFTFAETEAIHFALKQSTNRWRSDDPSQHESSPGYRQKLLTEKLEREFYDVLKA